MNLGMFLATDRKKEEGLDLDITGMWSVEREWRIVREGAGVSKKN
jgi:hypothetical protein